MEPRANTLLAPLRRMIPIGITRVPGFHPSGRRLSLNGQASAQGDELRTALGLMGSVVSTAREVSGDQDPPKRTVGERKPFRAIRVHHRRQEGSASMKKVLSAHTGEGYKHLDIQDGQTASLECLWVTSEDVSAEERRTVGQRLQDDYGRDTLGMVQIVEAMRRISGE